jgi:hypothetical protein
MGLLDDASKLKYDTVAAPDMSDVARLIKSGSDRQISGLSKRTPIIDKVQQERAAQQEGALQELLLSAPDETARMDIYNQASGRGDLSWADKGRVATSMRDLKQKQATEQRAVADQLIQQESHDITKEKNDYAITQRELLRDVKVHELKKAKAELGYAEADQNIENAEEARKASEHLYKIGAPRTRLEKGAQRKEELATIQQGKKLKKAQSPARVDAIFAKKYQDENGNDRPQTPKEFNAEARLHLDSGYVDSDGRLKDRANEHARMAKSGITEASINLVVDPDNKLSYSQAKYNSIIDTEFRRLKTIHPHADESLLLKSAKDAVLLTDAGMLFKDQKWFEDQNRAEKDVEIIRARKTKVKNTFDETIRDTVNSFNNMKKNRTRYSSDEFNHQVRKLNSQYANNPDDLGEGGKKILKVWTNRAIKDYTQNDLKPVQAFETKFSRQVKHPETGEMVTLPLGTTDYTPTNARAFIDAEVKKLSDQFPLADIGAIQIAVVDKIKLSNLSVKFAEGALPAKLKVAAQKYQFESKEKFHQKRSEHEQGIIDKGGVAFYAYDEVYKRLTNEQKVALNDSKFNQGKLQDELVKTVERWKSFIPNWRKLQKTNPEAIISYKQAMFEILSRVKIDKDLWIFDEDDFAISEYNRTGDISGIKKNEALSAIAGRLSNRSYAGINSPLIASLEASVEEYNKEEALKKKKALAALGDSGAF